jgi:hypothetical protein
MVAFISNDRFLGIFTMLGAVMIFGRIIDAVAADAPILMTQDSPQENLSIRIHASPVRGPGQITDGGFTSLKDFGILGSLLDHKNWQRQTDR